MGVRAQQNWRRSAEQFRVVRVRGCVIIGFGNQQALGQYPGKKLRRNAKAVKGRSESVSAT
jgi:hypothetical protein